MGNNLYNMILDRDFTNSIQSYISVLGDGIGENCDSGNPESPYFKEAPIDSSKKLRHGGQPLYVKNSDEFVGNNDDTAGTLMKVVIGFHAVGPAIVLAAVLAITVVAHIAAQLANPFPCGCIIHNPPWSNSP